MYWKYKHNYLDGKTTIQFPLYWTLRGFINNEILRYILYLSKVIKNVF